MDFYFSGLWYSLCYARIGVDLLSCWHQWLGKHNSNIWNLIPGCLMWNVWLERNRHSFENMKKTLDELKVLCKRSLFEWSHCWGFTESSSLPKFLFSLRLTIWFPSLIVHHREQLVLVIFYLLIIVLWLPIKKKKKPVSMTKTHIIWAYIRVSMPQTLLNITNIHEICCWI